MKIIAAVFLGGGMGSVFRYLISLTIIKQFPFATLAANTLSAFLLGAFIGLYGAKSGMHDNTYFFLTVGICGGFSTFSTFTSETVALVGSGLILHALLNVMANLLLSFALFAAGLYCSKFFI